MTDRQTETLAYIREYWQVWGYTPNEQEIAKWLGVTQPGVSQLLDRMERDGLIRRASARRPIIPVLCGNDPQDSI